jgi:DNA-binding beta-propeller fold protein YncE
VAIAYGNGAIWSTHERGDVARVDTGTNRFTERIRVGKATTGVVAAFGSIWVSDRQENRVYRIDPVDNSITARLDVCDVPSDLASFGESIWVACWTGAITRIDATSNRVMATTRVGGSPRLIEALDGALWIANWRHGTVSRFDIDANRVTAIIPIGPAELGFIRAAGGSVWVAGARNVIRILDRPRTAAVD